VSSNNTLERTVKYRGRIVLALDCVLADAQWRWWPPLNSVVRCHLWTTSKDRIEWLTKIQRLNPYASVIASRNTRAGAGGGLRGLIG